MSLRLTFYGGAEKVTGSNFLIEGPQGKVLVDCGMEQGADLCEECVYGPFPYEPSSINALLVTHAHLDHVGRIPKLVKDGFKGKIYSTAPTRDLAELILRDSVGILGEEAKRKHRAPLYTEQDVEAALSRFETIEYHEEKKMVPGLSVYLRNTGHILGSASVRVQAEDGSALAITGDIGNSPSPLLPDFEPITDVDALVMESVYGDRLHPPQEMRVAQLRDTLKRAIERSGAVLIPAFSLERTQLMLYELSNFFQAGELPRVPVFLDSPLAIRVTELYDKWGSTYFKPAAQREMKHEGSLFDFPFLTKTLSHENSEVIAKTPNPKIIIAGAGMSHGGRIGKWERAYLPDPHSTLITVGYQAPGTPGRRLVEGVRTIKIAGEEISVRAKTELLEGWSAHADRDELLSFAEQSLAGKRLKTIFTAIGEPAAERFLAQRIHDYLGAKAVVPMEKEVWEISKESVRKVS